MNPVDESAGDGERAVADVHGRGWSAARREVAHLYRAPLESFSCRHTPRMLHRARSLPRISNGRLSVALFCIVIAIGALGDRGRAAASSRPASTFVQRSAEGAADKHYRPEG